MRVDAVRGLIECGDTDGLRRALQQDAALANRPIHWHLNRDNVSDPLHYVADCVGRGLLPPGRDGDLARVLLESGAAIRGSPGREPPLIGAASLGADAAARVLVEAGAPLEAEGPAGSRALHWAAWTGASATVEVLLRHGAQLEVREEEHGATPLFWAVHGFGPRGPKPARDPLGAARLLLAAGAHRETSNREGLSALELAATFADRSMHLLLLEPVPPAPR